jgi:hypothetical protein
MGEGERRVMVVVVAAVVKKIKPPPKEIKQKKSSDTVTRICIIAMMLFYPSQLVKGAQMSKFHLQTCADTEIQIDRQQLNGSLSSTGNSKGKFVLLSEKGKYLVTLTFIFLSKHYQKCGEKKIIIFQLKSIPQWPWQCSSSELLNDLLFHIH